MSESTAPFVEPAAVLHPVTPSLEADPEPFPAEHPSQNPPPAPDPEPEGDPTPESPTLEPIPAEALEVEAVKPKAEERFSHAREGRYGVGSTYRD